MQFLVLQKIGRFLFSGKGFLTILIIALSSICVYQYYSIQSLESKLEKSVSDGATADAAHQICESDSSILRGKLDRLNKELEQRAKDYESRIKNARNEANKVISEIKKKEFESAEEMNQWYKDIISDY